MYEFVCIIFSTGSLFFVPKEFFDEFLLTDWNNADYSQYCKNKEKCMTAKGNLAEYFFNEGPKKDLFYNYKVEDGQVLPIGKVNCVLTIDDENF